MTLRETEETLQTLTARHPGLDEAMLVTLLRAGGWEERQIMEALTLYRTGTPHEPTLKSALPLLPDSSALPSQIDIDHLISEPLVPQDKMPESLVPSKEGSSPPLREEFPHNLPLRPFETSEHVWPFSRYRDVFYGEEKEEVQKSNSNVKSPQQIVPEIVSDQNGVVPNKPIVEKDTKDTVEPIVVPPAPSTRPVRSAPNDEKLVLLASVMLIVIIFLLTYMYSNGRL